MSLIAREFYRFDNFEVRPSQRSFLRNGEKISLSPKTFEVLVCLVSRAGRVVLKDELLKEVWPDSFVEESNLTQHIFWIRKALGDRADAVVTLPGRGYQFTAPVQVVPELEEEVPATPFADPIPVAGDPSMERVKAQYVRSRTKISISESAEPKPRSRVLILGLAVLTTAVITATAVYGVERWRHRPVPGDHHEVVLADFENTTGDPGFDHALRTLLAIDLNQSPFFVVASDGATNRTLKMMSKDPGQSLTPALAREVCQRMNDQVVLGGVLARFGDQYLVTLSANDCATGKELVSTKAISKDREGVMKAVDEIAADMRQRLGEPLKSLPHSQQPLAVAHTFSLDALRAYSQGRALQIAGKLPQAVPFYQRAIELDPKFVAAYNSLATCYRNMGEGDLSDATFTKAYDLRDLADDNLRFSIVYYHDTEVIGDKHQALRDLEAWTQMFPEQWSAFGNLADLQNTLGHPDLALEPAKRALELNPAEAGNWQLLADTQMLAGQLEEAKATCRKAFDRKIDAEKLHDTLAYIAFYQNDDAAFQQQIAWASGKSAEGQMTLIQARVAFARGKFHDAITLWHRMTDIYTKLGVPERGVRLSLYLPQKEADLGLIDQAKQAIKTTDPKLAAGYTPFTVALAEVGDVDRAQADLDHSLKEYPQDTVYQEYAKAWVQGTIDLQRKQPAEAINALEAGRLVELQDFAIPMTRGHAYLANNQGGLAADEFLKVIQHPGIDLISQDLPLAHLGLARAYGLQGNAELARKEYETLFTSWKDADADLPVLKQARAEYAKLM